MNPCILLRDSFNNRINPSANAGLSTNKHWLIFFSSIAVPRTPPRPTRRPGRSGPDSPRATPAPPGPGSTGGKNRQCIDYLRCANIAHFRSSCSSDKYPRQRYRCCACRPTASEEARGSAHAGPRQVHHCHRDDQALQRRVGHQLGLS